MAKKGKHVICAITYHIIVKIITQTGIILKLVISSKYFIVFDKENAIPKNSHVGLAKLLI